jgi:hypothetical protein
LIIAKRPRRYTGWPQRAHLPAPAVRIYCAGPSGSTTHFAWLAAERVQDLSETAWRKSANCMAGRSNGSRGLGGHNDLSRASQQQRCEAQRTGRLPTTRLEPNTASVTGPHNSEPEAQRGPAVLSTHTCRGHERCLVNKHAGCPSSSSVAGYRSPARSDALAVVWACAPQKYRSHIDASHSRQPLVKGERLVRYEVNAVMLMVCWHNRTSLLARNAFFSLSLMLSSRLPRAGC